MVDIEQAIKNPASVFKSPFEIVESSELSNDQKIKILKSWRYDAKQMSVATEENMPGNNNELLSKIIAALKLLDVPEEIESSQPTK